MNLVEYAESAFSPLRITDFAGLRGFAAATPIKCGDIVASIPSYLMLTPSASEEELRKSFNVSQENLDSIDWESSMCLLLVLVRRGTKSSRFTVHVMSFPEAESTFFDSWSVGEIAALQQPVRNDIFVTRRNRMADIFQDLQRVQSDLTETELRWAFNTISSRAFNLTQQVNPADTWCLLPFVDMFNHSPEGLSSFGFDAATGAFVFKAGKDYAVGEQVFLRYATIEYGVSHFARHYGFLPLDTHPKENDYFPVTLPPRKSDGTSHPSTLEEEASRRIIRDNGLDDRDDLYVGHGGVVSPRLVACLRILFAQGAEFRRVHVIVACAKAFTTCPVISFRNEFYVLGYLLEYVTKCLGRYTSTMKQDREVIEGGKLTIRQRMAMELRLRDKQVLTSSLAALQGQRDRLCGDLYFTMGESSEEVTDRVDALRVVSKIIATPVAFMRPLRDWDTAEHKLESWRKPRNPGRPKESKEY